MLIRQNSYGNTHRGDEEEWSEASSELREVIREPAAEQAAELVPEAADLRTDTEVRPKLNIRLEYSVSY